MATAKKSPAKKTTAKKTSAKKSAAKTVGTKTASKTASKTGSKASSKKSAKAAKQTSHCWPGFEPVAGKEPGEKGSCKPKAKQTAGEKKADSRAAAASKLEK